MYAAAIPPLDTTEENEQRTNLDDIDWGGKLDMSNPENFNDTDYQRKRI